jgi:Ca2+-binding RTX toxin-like protein
LDGGLGADTLTGGDGNDYFVVDNLSDVIVEYAGTSSGTDTIFSNIGYHALGENVEILLLGSGAVTGVGNSLNNTLIGNAFNNALFGGAGDDWIDGGSGRNTINGGLGADIMIGDGENDYFVVDNVGDSIMGGGGGDGIISEINGYTLNNGFVALVLGAGVTIGTGNSDNNTLSGNSLNNTLHGGSGEDTLLGDIGNDFYYINSSSDMVIEAVGRGTDTIEVSSVTTYTLANNVERLLLGSGAWNGVGNSLNNLLAGNADSNSLSGAGGNDTLLGALALANGGLGEIDTLTGGAGNDVFVLGTADAYLYNDSVSTSVGTSDYAFITDFTSGADKLQLVGSASNYYLGAHSVAGLTAHQGLFRELGATDELIAIIQGSPIVALNNTMVNWV